MDGKMKAALLQARKSLLSGRKILLFLDFDGTLAPLARNPYRARIGKAELGLLKALSEIKSIRTFIISGRDRKFLKAQISMKGITLVHDHALPPLKASQKQSYAKARARLEKLLSIFPGAVLEPKESSLNFNMAALSEGNSARAKNVMKHLIFPLLPPEGRVMRTKNAIELFFSEGGKGEFVSSAIAREPGCYPIAIGDEPTDEEMFGAVNMAGGLSVKVRKGATTARLALPSQPQVRQFLKLLAESLRVPRQREVF